MDVVSVGRISVDLYANEPNHGFDQQQSFTKSIGGSPTNLAIAAARLGNQAAIVTKVGDDGFGEYALTRLREFGVNTDFVGRQAAGQTPLALAALTPPESPSVIFYRGPAAPDTTIQTQDVPADLIRSSGVLWISHTTLSAGTTAEACMNFMKLRTADQYTILDLDYRPTLWSSAEQARDKAEAAIALSTVVVGNQTECEVALGIADPDSAADELLNLGVKLAIIKSGAEGSLFATKSERMRIKPVAVAVVCGLGSGDAFGGALCHGLLRGWPLEQIGEFANAAGALVATKLTCADAMPSEQQVLELQAVAL